MREITIENLNGIWIHEIENIRIEINIRHDNVSFYTEIDLSSNAIIIAIQGKAILINDDNTVNLQMDNSLIGELWYYPDDNTFWLSNNEEEKRRFDRL